MAKTKILTIALILSIFLITNVCALRIDSVSSSSDSIAPGETTSIALAIRNNGDNDISEVSVDLDLTNIPIAPYGSSSGFDFQEIESDRSRTAEFKLIALNDAKAGIYKIPVKISYIEEGKIKTEQSLISIMINSKPNVEVIVEDGLLLKGKQNTITIRVINKGLADVKFLEMQLGDSSYYTLLTQNKIYIGDVDSNDYQSSEFKIFFKENSADTINLPVKIIYRDISNKEYVKDSLLNIKVYSNAEALQLGLIKKSYTIPIVITIILLIVFFIVYRMLRRRRAEE